MRLRRGGPRYRFVDAVYNQRRNSGKFQAGSLEHEDLIRFCCGDRVFTLVWIQTQWSGIASPLQATTLLRQGRGWVLNQGAMDKAKRQRALGGSHIHNSDRIWASASSNGVQILAYEQDGGGVSHPIRT